MIFWGPKNLGPISKLRPQWVICVRKSSPSHRDVGGGRGFAANVVGSFTEFTEEFTETPGTKDFSDTSSVHAGGFWNPLEGSGIRTVLGIRFFWQISRQILESVYLCTYVYIYIYMYTYIYINTGYWIYPSYITVSVPMRTIIYSITEHNRTIFHTTPPSRLERIAYPNWLYSDIYVVLNPKHLSIGSLLYATPPKPRFVGIFGRISLWPSLKKLAKLNWGGFNWEAKSKDHKNRIETTSFPDFCGIYIFSLLSFLNACHHLLRPSFNQTEILNWCHFGK